MLPDDYDIPHPYTPAPRSRMTALLDGYRLAVKTCSAATAALDDLALATGTPSRVLAAAHTVPTLIPTRQPAQPGQIPANQTHGHQASDQLQDALMRPGRMEDTVRDLQLTEPALLRAAAIDEAARDLLAEATAKSGRQTPSHKPTRPIRAGSPGSRP